MLVRLLGKMKLFKILEISPYKPPDVVNLRGTPHPPFGHLPLQGEGLDKPSSVSFRTLSGVTTVPPGGAA